MKKNAGPIAVAIAAAVLVGVLAVMYQIFFPPQPPPDTANPKSMPKYAQDFLKKKQEGQGGMPVGPGGSMGGGMPRGPGGSMGGGTPTGR